MGSCNQQKKEKKAEWKASCLVLLQIMTRGHHLDKKPLLPRRGWKKVNYSTEHVTKELKKQSHQRDQDKDSLPIIIRKMKH